MNGNSISEGIVCEKELPIYSDLLKETPSTSAKEEIGFTFKASRDWSEKLMHRSEIHSAVRHGEAARSNNEAAEKCIGEFRNFFNAGGYLPQQVTSCDENGLFPKRCLGEPTYMKKKNQSLNTNP